MKRVLIIFLAATLLSSCKKEEKIKIDEDYVISKLQESWNQIDALEYQMKIEYLSSSPDTMITYTGEDLLYRSEEDTLLGYHFYGRMDGVQKEYI
jgi:hypothetical protein